MKAPLNEAEKRRAAIVAWAATLEGYELGELMEALEALPPRAGKLIYAFSEFCDSTIATERAAKRVAEAFTFIDADPDAKPDGAAGPE